MMRGKRKHESRSHETQTTRISREIKIFAVARHLQCPPKDLSALSDEELEAQFQNIPAPPANNFENFFSHAEGEASIKSLRSARIPNRDGYQRVR